MNSLDTNSGTSQEMNTTKLLFEYTQKIELLQRQLEAERELCQQLKQQNDELKLQENKIEVCKIFNFCSKTKRKNIESESNNHTKRENFSRIIIQHLIVYVYMYICMYIYIYIESNSNNSRTTTSAPYNKDKTRRISRAYRRI
jgi:hypothetical protein